MAEPEFTDTSRAALMWVLWHHQGGSSPTGQAVRFALGMGQFDRLTADQVAQAKSWAPGIPGLANTDPAGVQAVKEPQPLDMLLYCPNCGMQHVDAPETTWKEALEATGRAVPPEAEAAHAEKWTNPPHRSHKCHGCGCIWRPADVPTNGVAELKTQGKADTWPAAHNEEVRAMPACGVSASRSDPTPPRGNDGGEQ